MCRLSSLPRKPRGLPEEANSLARSETYEKFAVCGRVLRLILQKQSCNVFRDSRRQFENGGDQTIHHWQSCASVVGVLPDLEQMLEGPTVTKVRKGRSTYIRQFFQDRQNPEYGLLIFGNRFPLLPCPWQGYSFVRRTWCTSRSLCEFYFGTLWVY
jgi:hypothetical protein